ncbi:MAG: GTPase subunit of restriction endonuclease-like protein, partial [Gemmatimonadales bacterium]|nr:GTPase subunit of restriction endonuclease-like protein [Gemmatimonadales bacterium]
PDAARAACHRPDPSHSPISAFYGLEGYGKCLTGEQICQQRSNNALCSVPVPPATDKARNTMKRATESVLRQITTFADEWSPTAAGLTAGRLPSYPHSPTHSCRKLAMSPKVSIAEAADGSQIVHYDGQSFELTPSPGRVICAGGTGTAIHHRPDCMHIAGTDGTWKTYPDPDGNLWARLIESAYSNDPEGRQAFAERQGLRNGRGGLAHRICETCTLTPTAVGGVRSPQKPLSTALADFDRESCAKHITETKQDIAQVLRDFPLDSWPDMPLERYALGTPDYTNSFCHRMEFGTPALCSMKGGSAKKHLVYQRKSDHTWYFDPAYGNEQEAWSAVRAGFAGAFDAAREGRLTDIDLIEALRSGPALTAKAISCYFSDLIVPITSRDHVRRFIFHLSGDAGTGLDPFAAHERLKNLIDADERFAGWHPYEIAEFLYQWADPRPNTTVIKIAPGPRGMYWDDCLAGGYICVGWDEVGDLTAYTSEDDFREAFRRAYAALYNGNQSKLTAKGNEVWRMVQLQPGDLVVANRGTKEVLAAGKVTEAGYVWRPEREEYRHTVSVDWDTSYKQILAEPQKSWGTVTVAKVSASLWKTLKTGAPPNDHDDPTPVDPLFNKLAAHLSRKGQTVLYGPPGTGKTYTGLRFALWWLATQLPELNLDPTADYGKAPFLKSLTALSASADGKETSHLTQVTFHPAYGYEDFIEGFRPIQSKDGGLKLDLVDGTFKKVCTAAAKDPDKPYLVLIDEINRGDIPKILGELITLLDRDKRGMQVVLPQSGKRFSVPPNVYILGTMNTADRSIRLLDSALRRRFAFHELLPDAEVLDGSLVNNLDLGILLRELNRRVVKELGRERQIGHSFFWSGNNPVDDEAELAAVIRTEVLPLLQEYAYDDYSMLARFLGSTVVDVAGHCVADLDDEKLVEALYAELQVDASGQ